MTIVINGSGTVTGISVGGLPDNTVDNGTMADDAIGVAELSATGTASSSTFLRGDNAWAAPGGIANACQFRVTSNWNPSDSWTDITANWEVNDTAGYSTLGSAVTESSGIFSFPSTGFWYITFGGMADYNGSAVNWASLELQATINNSSYTALTLATAGIADGGSNTYTQLNGDAILDVTDTSNVKCKLRTETDADTTWHGATANNQTWITFIRLADT
tara:strand:- start:394 stop:1047 length:654 start_codon:yes stop_codon:yes gene_type:complete